MYTKVQALCLQCYYNAIVNYFLDQTCIFVIKKLINLFLPRSFTLQLHLVIIYLQLMRVLFYQPRFHLLGQLALYCDGSWQKLTLKTDIREFEKGQYLWDCIRGSSFFPPMGIIKDWRRIILKRALTEKVLLGLFAIIWDRDRATRVGENLLPWSQDGGDEILNSFNQIYFLKFFILQWASMNLPKIRLITKKKHKLFWKQ